MRFVLSQTIIAVTEKGENDMEECKFTDEEIIKALELCIQNTFCESCEYREKTDKSDICPIRTDALNLINKQNAEIETLKDNNEHLAVILEETKAEVEKLQNELVIWKQNRFNLFQRLECYEMVRQKVAREIFEELDNLKKQYIKGDIDEHKFIVRLFLLKKKYTEGEQ